MLRLTSELDTGDQTRREVLYSIIVKTLATLTWTLSFEPTQMSVSPSHCPDNGCIMGTIWGQDVGG